MFVFDWPFFFSMVSNLFFGGWMIWFAGYLTREYPEPDQGDQLSLRIILGIGISLLAFCVFALVFIPVGEYNGEPVTYIWVIQRVLWGLFEATLWGAAVMLSFTGFYYACGVLQSRSMGYRTNHKDILGSSLLVALPLGIGGLLLCLI